MLNAGAITQCYLLLIIHLFACFGTELVCGLTITMTSAFTSIEDFMLAISGKWLSPATNTQFHFITNANDPGFGQVNIFQPNIKTPVVLNTSGKWKNSNLMLVVENEYYEVTIMGSQVKSLFITLSPGNILHLVKKSS